MYKNDKKYSEGKKTFSTSVGEGVTIIKRELDETRKKQDPYGDAQYDGGNVPLWYYDPYKLGYYVYGKECKDERAATGFAEEEFDNAKNQRDAYWEKMHPPTEYKAKSEELFKQADEAEKFANVIADKIRKGGAGGHWIWIMALLCGGGSFGLEFFFPDSVYNTFAYVEGVPVPTPTTKQIVGYAFFCAIGGAIAGLVIVRPVRHIVATTKRSEARRLEKKHNELSLSQSDLNLLKGAKSITEKIYAEGRVKFALRHYRDYCSRRSYAREYEIKMLDAERMMNNL